MDYEDESTLLAEFMMALYEATDADLHHHVPPGLPFSKLGADLSSGQIRQLLKELEDRSLIELADMTNIDITYDGIMSVEAALRDDVKRPVTGHIGALLFQLRPMWMKMEWERFTFMKSLMTIERETEGRVADPYSHLQPRIGFTEEVFHRTLFFAQAANWVELQPRQVASTFAGRAHVGKLVGELREADLIDPSVDQFVTFLTKRLSKPEKTPGPRPEDYPDALFQDEDGQRITVTVLKKRWGISKSRLKEWREKGCPALGGRRLLAKMVPGVGWVYSRIDVQDLVARREDKANTEKHLEQLDEIETLRRGLLPDLNDD
jgi:hypothetical protein